MLKLMNTHWKPWQTRQPHCSFLSITVGSEHLSWVTLEAFMYNLVD